MAVNVFSFVSLPLEGLSYLLQCSGKTYVAIRCLLIVPSLTRTVISTSHRTLHIVHMNEDRITLEPHSTS